MKPFSAVVFLFVVLLVQGAGVQAQGVYMTPGPNGPVFSDKPQPGAQEVTLKPLNVVPAVRQQKSEAPAAPVVTPITDGTAAAEAVASDYRKFEIVFPESNGSVVANTAVFEVRVAVDPPLLLGDRHAIVVSINGRTVGQRFTANEFMIPPEFWDDQLPPPNQEMQLDASIIDGNGQVLKKAAPVRFFVRHARVVNQPHRPVKRPVVVPDTPPKVPASKPKAGQETGVIIDRPKGTSRPKTQEQD